MKHISPHLPEHKGFLSRTRVARCPLCLGRSRTGARHVSGLGLRPEEDKALFLIPEGSFAWQGLAARPAFCTWPWRFRVAALCALEGPGLFPPGRGSRSSIALILGYVYVPSLVKSSNWGCAVRLLCGAGGPVCNLSNPTAWSCHCRGR